MMLSLESLPTVLKELLGVAGAASAAVRGAAPDAGMTVIS